MMLLTSAIMKLSICNHQMEILFLSAFYMKKMLLALMIINWFGQTTHLVSSAILKKLVMIHVTMS